MSHFAIIYSDMSVYQGPPEEAPTRDVQVIVQPDEETGFATQTGADYYVWRQNTWFGVDKFGLFDYLIEPGWKRVLMGRTVTREEYNRCYQLALDLRIFGNKHGYLPGERKPE